MAEAKSKTGNQVFDVAKPGQTAAEASAKPIIVTNHPMLKDPMMVEEKPAENAPDAPKEESTPIPSTSKLRIEPLHREAEEQDTSADTPDTKTENSATTESEPASKSEDVPEDETPDTAKKSKTDIQNDEVAERKAVEREAELEKLVESRKYYLPINQVVKRRNKRMLWIVLILVVALGGAYAALDAGYLNVPGVKAPTHFFKTSSKQ